MDELESLKQQLEELKRLRNELSVTQEKVSQEETTDIEKSVKVELEKIDEQIKELETEVKKTAKEYESSYKKLQSAIDEYEEKTESTKLLSQEEIEELKLKTEKIKLEENERSNEIKNKLDAQKRIIKELKAKKTRIENNIKKAEALGLSIEEYREITEAIGKTTIMNAILEKKGLSSIIDKKPSERTKEEKELLKAAKKEVLDEISQVKKVNKEYSVIDAIEALYSLEVTYKEVKKPRVMEIKKNELQVLKENSLSLPFRIVTSKTVNSTYTPEETPEDMKEVMAANDKVEIDSLKPAEERVTLFKDKDTNDYYVRKYTVNRFKLKSADFDNEVRINGSVCYKISEEDVEKIKNNANNAFSPYIATEKEITLEKTPLIEAHNDVPLIEANVVTDNNDIDDKVTIFKATDKDNYYVKKYIIDRFKLKSADLANEVNIDGNKCYKISVEDVEKIANNADNSYSPYITDIKEVTVDEEIDKEEISEDDIKSVFEEALELDKDEIESKINDRINEYLYGQNVPEEDIEYIPFADLDIENKDNTTSTEEEISEDDIKKAFEEKLKEEEKVNNTTSTEEEISEDDIKKAFEEKLEEEEKVNNTTSTTKEYTYKDFNMVPEGFDELVAEGFEPGTEEWNQQLRMTGMGTPLDLDKKEENISSDESMTSEKNNPKRQKVDASVLGNKEEYYDNLLTEADNKYIKASQEYESALIIGTKEEIKEAKQRLDKATNDYIELSQEIQALLEKEENKVVEKTTEPGKKDDSKQKEQPKKKENDAIIDNKYSETSVEAIIYKITKGLDIGAKDGKRFVASNIRPSKNFKNELSSGNYQYNIVHVVPAAINFVASTARKLVSKLMLGARGKKVCEEMAKRMEDLSETELKTLFDKYKGTRLKADMNNQINPIILDGLRKYVLNQVEKYNETIKKCYVELFASLEEIKEIDKKLKAKGLTEESRKSYLESRKQALKKAAANVRTIEESYDKANELLSSGLHGIEEDFRAVATKLSYVGLRFAKEHKFNNELQKELAEADVKLAEGLATDNDEKIVDGYMAKEKIYYEHTKIGNSIFGKRSKGEKYYTPYIERLDYRPDPFVRDLLTTVAATTAVVSAINAFRVHQIEDAQFIDAQNAEAARINAANDKLLTDVGDQASQIVAQRATIQKGLVAQMNQDVTNVAHGAERTALDTVNWTTGTSTYRALDDANHAMYNSFYDTMTSSVNDIVNRCASGTISQAQATNELLALSSDAQSTFVGVAQGCLDQLKIYAPAHPQFDLHATQEALQYIVDNPTAITDMNTAAVEATNIAEGLIGLTPAHVQALSYLPTDWTTTIIGAAGSVALIDNIARNMKARETDNSKSKWKKTKEVRDMLDEYISDDEESKSKQR